MNKVAVLPEQKRKKLSIVRTSLMMIINPAGAIKRQLQHVNWKITLIIPALAFAILFLQTGIDQSEGNMVYSFGLSALGILYGGIGVTLIGMLVSVFIKSSNEQLNTRGAVISAIHLSYTAMLVYQIIGVTFSLTLGWNTAVAFGVPGMLMALRPIMITIRQSSNSRVLSIVLTTIIGLVLLVGWSVLGIIGGY